MAQSYDPAGRWYWRDPAGRALRAPDFVEVAADDADLLAFAALHGAPSPWPEDQAAAHLAAAPAQPAHRYDPAVLWYWRADDGRVFQAPVGALLTDVDPGFLGFVAALGYVPEWPRDTSDARAQTIASLQAVLDGHGLSADIAHLKARLCVAVDEEAEARRARVVTPGAGQAMVYLQKQTQAAQALAGAAAQPPMTAAQGAAAFALLAAEVGLTVDPSTAAPAADVFGVARAVAATVTAWLPIAARIEAARLGAKAAIRAAATAEAVQAAHDAAAWPA